MSIIKEALQEFNPWWKSDHKIEFKPRDIYQYLKIFLPLPQIIAVTGLRRVGKTTIMLRIVEEFIQEGWHPRNIIYFSFDEFGEAIIREILGQYEELTKNDINSGKFLLLLDEVQKLENWEAQVKTLYDLSKERIKIIISGSESLFIKSKTKESLAGRIFEFKVDPLSFPEFLSFKGLEFKPPTLYTKELLLHFNEFTRTQGFPELVNVNDKEIIRKYLIESIIEKVLYRDMQQLFKVKNMNIVRSLLNIIMEQPGQIIDLSKLAGTLKITRQTLSNYLTYLEESFLIKKLYNFSNNRRKIERKLKKYYPVIVSVNLTFKEDDFSKSKVFECTIVNQLKAEFFWRDPYKHEVDVILADESVMPVEIKYGKIDTKNLFVFMKKFNVNDGYIVTTTIEEKRIADNKKINIIPGYKFLLDPLSTKHN